MSWYFEEKDIAKTWWGKSWHAYYLKKYKAYQYHFDRGCAGMDLDLEIEEGLAKSQVVDSGARPYRVEIRFDLLCEKRAKMAMDAIESKIESAEQLMSGQFSEELKVLFLGREANLFQKHEDGIFPLPKEIRFECNCLSHEDICKHCAATLYGIGMQLDKDPLLFFKLRGIDFNVFLRKVAENRLFLLLKKAEKKTGRMIEDWGVEGVAGLSWTKSEL